MTMHRKTIYSRLLEGVSLRALCSIEGDGAASNDAGGGGGSASSPTPAPSGGGGDGGPSGSPPSAAPAATPTPGPSPSAEPAGAPTTPAADPGNPWDNLGRSDFEDPDVLAIPAEPPTPASQPAPQPAPQPVTPPAPAPAPAAKPEPAAQPAPGPQAQPAVLPSPGEPAALAAAMTSPENMPRIIEHLAQTRFMLTDAEVEELNTDVTTAVPKLLARAHVEATAAAMRFVEQSVPHLLQRHTQASKANNEAQEKFFSAHKGLDKNNKQHVETAVRLVSLYRAANKDASLEQVIAEVGPMVLATLQINGQAQPASASPASPAPAAVAFRPAVGGGGASPASPQDNQWMGMGQSFDEE